MQEAYGGRKFDGAFQSLVAAEASTRFRRSGLAPCPLQDSRLDNAKAMRMLNKCVGPYLVVPCGRKPPPMAEVGQFIFLECIIIVMRFMEAKELSGAAVLQVWHGTCSALNLRIPL
jgi:hypothetical protein